MNQHIITISVTLVGDTTPAQTSARLAEIADACEEAIDDRFSPDNARGSIEAPFRFDRTPGPYVTAVTAAPVTQLTLVTSPRNIADSPEAIAAHLATPQSARTAYKHRTSQLHLRELPDGYWTRIRLVTARVSREYVSTLIFDHHREHETGEQVRAIPGAEFIVRTTDAGGQITAHLFEQAHADAAKVLVAYPEAIATLLNRTQAA